MGQDRRIILEPEKVPSYSAWTARLSARGIAVQLRMIDGELAFPDEIPPENWKELRVSLPAGMITLRREPDGIRAITWGNATPELLKGWNAAAWALALEGEGKIVSDQREESAEEFARREGI